MTLLHTDLSHVDAGERYSMLNMARADNMAPALHGTSAGTTAPRLMMDSRFSVEGPEPTKKKGSMSAERRKLRAESLVAEANNRPSRYGGGQRVRFHNIIGSSARSKHVGESQSCMVSK